MYLTSAYVTQALAMGSTKNCFLWVSNTTTEGTAMCTNNKGEGQWEQGMHF